MIHNVFSLLSLLPKRPRRAAVRRLMDTVWDLRTSQEVIGHENIPDPPCLFICNHLSNADGFTLDRALRPRKVFFLAGIKLQTTVMTRLGTEAVDTIFIRPNSADIEPLKRAVETLKAGHSVLIFPEGGRSRTGALIQAKKGASLIARRAGVPVVPVALTGTEKFMPIDDRDMGREQVRRAHLTVRFGTPFRMDELEAETSGAEDPRQALTDAMMRRVAKLLPPEYRGVYAHPAPEADEEPSAAPAAPPSAPEQPGR
ncbi:1-acyl-sn-glycerol-3-phosphate acyltransferase [Vitiosangium sp. GDMCC 1.1324]|uniref:lysophospholipid acyltransferase family protein n=1 Tax=Vitiosangium sp. (strain GDMCC 1.1324) TaxID=2138576 RepID=UPI000D378B1C|nr:lysophospholipid acyltransferase family protein [Vitiosangium sp. GDMCC 1.1324]PTL83098.1 1-acyl-sn-glycerol-3-phosphate acyltransferase [Vitiosangium sp. GDMCC 1.1324]